MQVFSRRTAVCSNSTWLLLVVLALHSLCYRLVVQWAVFQTKHATTRKVFKHVHDVSQYWSTLQQTAFKPVLKYRLPTRATSSRNKLSVHVFCLFVSLLLFLFCCRFCLFHVLLGFCSFCFVCCCCCFTISFGFFCCCTFTL